MRLSLPSVLLLCAGCAGTTVLSPPVREDLAQRVHGRRQYLAVSMYAGPFFREADRQLLSAAPFSELRLLEGPGGGAISPGVEEMVWPAGTEVRVREVEFPTGLVVTRRPILTPRYHPWVMLEVASVPPPPPPHQATVWILVLRDGIESPDAFWTEWRKYLAEDPPTPEQAELVAQKRAKVGMSAADLAMAWGPPTRKVYGEPQGGVRREEWQWFGGERRALLEGGRVIEVWPSDGMASAAAVREG